MAYGFEVIQTTKFNIMKERLINCENCNFIGNDGDLQWVSDKIFDRETDHLACPNCLTDAYLTDNEWIITDPDTKQMYREVKAGEQYYFRENRGLCMDTFEPKVFEKLMNIRDYNPLQQVRACTTFDYPYADAVEWVRSGSNVELILECLFELEC